MITTIVIVVFIIGYITIAFEHSVKINKAAPALIMAVICWLFTFMQATSVEMKTEELLHHLGEISSILFFLLGAMTIVELIDLHGGFDLITERINTTNKSRLVLIVSVFTFFLSALLDNLTTAIVMVSLVSRIIHDNTSKLYFSGLIVIAANAGGAWSPIGDVTTTMLWIGNQVTAFNIIKVLILPSIIVASVPTALLMYRFRGQTFEKKSKQTEGHSTEGRIVLGMGLLLLMFIPVFKTLTHLPPFMGMLLSLGIMWAITSTLHTQKQPEIRERLSVAHALQKIDSQGILFFLGILLSVAALQSLDILKSLATVLANILHNDFLIGTVLGLLSSVVDNVPLVAATQGMYDLSTYPTDHYFWEFLALTTGTGGSAIIIGSAAGVAVMGIQKIDFMWYLRKISFIALLGFFAGIITYILQNMLQS
ncbi:sodium:proton antiporter NhaD [Parabacteroides sp. FAFU027]|uniref:sodium:proton antiporter NhaD n=1 Tax=Parabacteroides sp. FAFU027 TaxID=2922715 RepID=UPI001FB02B77|nr:sodium:proton antiporter NhaD [Parabacteroides sp. FAFU027]